MESLASPLEMWSKERQGCSYARLTAPDTAGAAVRAHCRKREGMTQSSFTWRNSRRSTRRRFWWILHRGKMMTTAGGGWGKTAAPEPE